jgi:acyl carrier protein
LSGCLKTVTARLIAGRCGSNFSKVCLKQHGHEFVIGRRRISRRSTLKASARSDHRIGEMTDMIEHNGVHQQLTELFAKKMNLEVSSVDTDLVGSGLLDSLALVELLAQLEETFGVSISTDDLEPENFRSIDSIAGFVARRTAAVEAA